ncbi:hypothetical protein NXW62_13750 [Bacteroides fragilis]|nr:hypothetical protein [Bacteroides fragilis]
MKIHDCFILLRIDICLIWDVILHTTWRFVRNIYLFEYDLFRKYFMAEIAAVERYVFPFSELNTFIEHA